MSIRRIISVTVAVSDPITIHVKGGDTQMLQKLVDIYEGKCFFGYKIIKVLWIIKMDATVISLSNSANVPVSFMAETICYSPGDIIVGFKPIVRQAIDKTIYGSFEHGYALMPIDSTLPMGGPETLHIANVLSATYETSTPNIILRIGFYRHPESFTVWECSGDYDEVDQAREIATQIKAIEKSLGDNDAVQFFKDLFYPWRARQAVPRGAKEYNLVELSSRTGRLPKYLCLDPRVPAGTVLGYEENIFPADYIIGEGLHVVDVMIELLSEHLKNLHALRHATEIFDNAKRNAADQLTIWRAINGMKR